MTNNEAIRAEWGVPMALQTAAGFIKNWDGQQLTCASGHPIPGDEARWRGNESGYKLFDAFEHELEDGGAYWLQVLPPLANSSETLTCSIEPIEATVGMEVRYRLTDRIGGGVGIWQSSSIRAVTPCDSHDAEPQLRIVLSDGTRIVKYRGQLVLENDYTTAATITHKGRPVVLPSRPKGAYVTECDMDGNETMPGQFMKFPQAKALEGPATLLPSKNPEKLDASDSESQERGVDSDASKIEVGSYWRGNSVPNVCVVVSCAYGEDGLEEVIIRWEGHAGELTDNDRWRGHKFLDSFTYLYTCNTVEDLKKLRKGDKLIDHETGEVVRVRVDPDGWRSTRDEQHGVCSVNDLPSCVLPSGYLSWSALGHCHRLVGPAIIESDGAEYFYIEGFPHAPDEWADKVLAMGKADGVLEPYRHLLPKIEAAQEREEYPHKLRFHPREDCLWYGSITEWAEAAAGSSAADIEFEGDEEMFFWWHTDLGGRHDPPLVNMVRVFRPDNSYRPDGHCSDEFSIWAEPFGWMTERRFAKAFPASIFSPIGTMPAIPRETLERLNRIATEAGDVE